MGRRVVIPVASIVIPPRRRTPSSVPFPSSGRNASVTMVGRRSVTARVPRRKGCRPSMVVVVIIVVVVVILEVTVTVTDSTVWWQWTATTTLVIGWLSTVGRWRRKTPTTACHSTELVAVMRRRWATGVSTATAAGSGSFSLV